MALLRYATYPVVLLACVIGNMVLLRQGARVLLATYGPVTLGTLIVIILEGCMSYRVEWRPSRAEVVQDSTFLALVHVILPKTLAVTSAFLLF